jgi:predicted regulator of Ras-like GTPase activity (Roadblock/LC7/MglB family)
VTRPRPAGGEDDVAALVLDQLATLRRGVRGIRGSLVATSDGLLVASDIADDEPEQLAALTSTLVGLAGFAVEVTGTGTLIEAVARGDRGYVAAYAVGAAAALAVVGDADLNVAMLHLKTKPVVERLTALSDRFVGFVDAAAAVGAPYGTARVPNGRA